MAGDHFLNLQPGTIVNGRYEVVKCLGTGSMGMVYACRHRELAGHIVAMKVLFSEVARDEVAAARFRNEIVASYGVSHPNVVRAYEYFRDGDLIAFTMEYIGGGDLADRVGGQEEIPIDEIVNMLSQMASGVQAIHDAGIIHRDLKPENILITAQGDIKITDFGIARTGTGPKLTEHGGVVGTIDYVSPEYLDRGQVDRRSDIYAFGVLAYEMVTGSPPFKGKSVIETMTLRLRTDPEPPHHLRTDCPVALSNIILKAMTREPEQRYQQAREILDDLDAMRSAKKQRSAVTTSGVHMRPDLRKAPDQEVRTSARPAQAGATTSVALGSAGSQSYIPTFSGSAEQPRSFSSGNHTGERARASRSSGSDAKIPRPSGSGRREVQPPRTPPPSGSNRRSEQRRDPMQHEPRRDSRDMRDPRDSRDSMQAVEDRLSPSVAVSNSRLSTERIKELSLDLYQPRRGLMQTLLFRMLLLFVSFGVGVLVWKHFKPDLFGEAPAAVLSGFDARP